MNKRKVLASLVLGFLTLFDTVSATTKYANYDFIIVGNGSAGAILARKLSDSLKKSVLVLEAGINHDNDPVTLNANELDPNFAEDLTIDTLNPRYAKIYGVPLFAPLSGSGISVGWGWGGGSSHNYLEVVRGTPLIYNTWAQITGDSFWSYDNLLPFMLALENYTPYLTAFNPAQRGQGGPISITQSLPPNSDPYCMALATGTNAGFNPDINDPTQTSSLAPFNPSIGFSAFQFFGTPKLTPIGQVADKRSFSAREFLTPDVVQPSGDPQGKRLLVIKSNALVSRVVFKGKKAMGVEYVYGSTGQKTGTAYGKEIILCAGAINTAAILQRSGIGDPELLNSVGVKVLVANSNVGRMFNQYGGALVASIPTTSGFSNGFVNGSYATPFSAPYNYPNDAVRRLQFVGVPTIVDGSPATAILPFILQPKSIGSVKIVSRNPLTDPLINLNMYSNGDQTVHGSDLNLMLTAYYLVKNSIVAAGGTMIVPPTVAFGATPGANPALDQKLVNDFIETISGNTISSHYLGTACMGTSIDNGVVDSKLRVFGVKGLRVADLSVVPQLLPSDPAQDAVTSPDGNTCYAAYVIGLAAAKLLGVDTPPAL